MPSQTSEWSIFVFLFLVFEHLVHWKHSKNRWLNSLAHAFQQLLTSWLPVDQVTALTLGFGSRLGHWQEQSTAQSTEYRAHGQRLVLYVAAASSKKTNQRKNAALYCHKIWKEPTNWPEQCHTKLNWAEQRLGNKFWNKLKPMPAQVFETSHTRQGRFKASISHRFSLARSTSVFVSLTTGSVHWTRYSYAANRNPQKRSGKIEYI